MNPERPQPITIHDTDRLTQWARALIGRRIVGVRYISPEGTRWPHGHSAEAIHEVDMDVRILLDDGTSAFLSWAMQGFVEGIDLRFRRNSGTKLEANETDVTTTPQWRGAVDNTVDEVAAAWHVPNEGCPDTLWSVRLSLRGVSAITIALGEIKSKLVKYQPDALLVIFDEATARAYVPPASAESAFGTAIEL